MASFSDRHYRLVNPPADTAAEIAERLIFRQAAALGLVDREAGYPVLTAENAQAAVEYQEQRIRAHYAALRGVQAKQLREKP